MNQDLFLYVVSPPSPSTLRQGPVNPSFKRIIEEGTSMHSLPFCHLGMKGGGQGDVATQDSKAPGHTPCKKGQQQSPPFNCFSPGGQF